MTFLVPQSLPTVTPEEQARLNIDQQLKHCGWHVQDFGAMNIFAGEGVAVREFQLSTGEADYGLYIDGKVAGVIEAKKVGENLTGVETQTDKYAKGLPDGVPHHTDEQMQWLVTIEDHIASSLMIEQDDFEYAPFNQFGVLGLGRAYELFGEELTRIMEELNTRRAA